MTMIPGPSGCMARSQPLSSLASRGGHLPPKKYPDTPEGWAAACAAARAADAPVVAKEDATLKARRAKAILCGKKVADLDPEGRVRDADKARFCAFCTLAREDGGGGGGGDDEDDEDDGDGHEGYYCNFPVCMTRGMRAQDLNSTERAGMADEACRRCGTVGEYSRIVVVQRVSDGDVLVPPPPPPSRGPEGERLVPADIGGVVVAARCLGCEDAQRADPSKRATRMYYAVGWALDRDEWVAAPLRVRRGRVRAEFVE